MNRVRFHIEEVKTMLQVQNDWQPIIDKQASEPYFQQLMAFVEQQYNKEVIYPTRENILNALKLTSFQDTKVVILGQDPYHGPNQAHGLSFSVLAGNRLPPSLRNMFVELQEDIGCATPQSGNLTKWAQQGVLLLNTVLTVQQGKANSHAKQGWETFTDALIMALAKRSDPVVFVLWGKSAQAKAKTIKKYPQHTIIESVHPSPLSAYRGFFGSKPYSKVNEALMLNGQQSINWCL